MPETAGGNAGNAAAIVFSAIVGGLTIFWKIQAQRERDTHMAVSAVAKAAQDKIEERLSSLEKGQGEQLVRNAEIGGKIDHMSSKLDDIAADSRAVRELIMRRMGSHHE
jgi:hypothetical protein